MATAVRRLSVSVAAGLLACGLLASAGGTAGAAPQPTIGQVQKQLERLNSEESAIGQRYIQTLQQLAATSRELALVDQEASKYQARFQSLRAKIARIAVAKYMDGNMTPAALMLTSGDPQQILDRSSILVELEANDSAQIGQVLAAARQIAGARQMALRVRDGILAVKNKLEAQRRSLRGLITREQALQAQLSPAQQAATGPGGTPSSGTTYTGPTKTQAQKAIAFAYAQIGKPYQWGATGPDSYDCSGLMMAAWAAAGVSIPRTTYEEWAGLPHVSMSQIQPGDLILFAGESHVAMYVGGGYLIDAPHAGLDVEKVAMSGWYAQNAEGAVRP